MLITFIATTWLLAMLPGVGQALMLRQTLAEGPRVAIATVLGTSTGLLIWATAAGAGLSAAVLADPAIYRSLVLLGGLALIAIGVRTTWHARRADEPDLAPSVAPSGRRRIAYLAGLATNLANPKAGVFAISLLPAFAGAAAGRFLPTFGLGVIWATVTASWYLLFVWFVQRGAGYVTRPAVQRGLGYLSGLVLVGVGTTVALGL